MAGKITTNLAGNKTSNLTLAVNNSSGARTLSIPHGTVHTNSFNDSFRTAIPAGQYGSVTATWDTTTVSVPVNFYTIGYTHFTQYNTPYQSACSGTSQPVSIIYRIDLNAQYCYYHNTTRLLSSFVSAVNQNGTGVNDTTGEVLKSYAAGAMNICPTNGFPSISTFFAVDAGGNPNIQVTGTHNTVLSDASGGGSAFNNYNHGPVALLPTRPQQTEVRLFMSGGTRYSCSTKTTTTIQGVSRSARYLCPACSGHATGSQSSPAHIDMYNGISTSCSASAVGDYGYYNAIRVR